MIAGQPDPSQPSFPPMFRGEALRADMDPFAKAVSSSMRGIDPGLIIWSEDTTSARAALVLTPEEPLERAIAVVFAAALGLSDSLGALAPPEVAVHLDWAGSVRVNGAACGRLRVAASTEDPAVEPDWLVVGLELPLWPEGDDPGITPDQTTLYSEGCADVDPVRLLESWARHTLVWINEWLDGGNRKLHADWRSRAYALGEEVTALGQTGVFMGLDEACGMLLRQGDDTKLIPLTDMLEHP